MRQRPLIDLIALLGVFSAIVVVTLFKVSDDTLFFHSDLKSGFMLVGAAGAAVTLILLVPAALLLRLQRVGPRLNASVALSIAALIVAILILFVLDFLQAQFKIIGPLPYGLTDLVFVAFWVAAYVITRARLSKHADREGIIERVTRASRIVTPIASLAVIGLVAHARLTGGRAADAPAPKRVVMIVLDAWPADYLHTYNPAAPERQLDELFKNALVFRNMHTNTVWTHGYFGTLYRGTARYSFSKPSKLGRRTSGGEGAASSRFNLFSSLQRLGVNTRWVVFHRAGIPESRPISGYDGFRSVNLTHRYARMLRAIGLDYNLVMANPAIAKMVSSRRVQLVFGPLNSLKDFDDSLHEVLLPEIRALDRTARPSFLLFHTRWTAGDVSLPAAWDDATGKDKQRDVFDDIKANDNRYSPSQEWLAADMRRETAHYMDLMAEKLGRLLSDLEAEHLLDNTMLIITADHGHMYDRGRFWYGFHPDEEVARVPMIVFNAGRTGFDDEKRETIDITQTILEYFGATGRPNPRARSILAPANKEYTATETQRSVKHREWFVALYVGDRKVLCNVDPKSDGNAVETTLAGDTLASGSVVIDGVKPYLAESLQELGLPLDEIHPRYRALVPAHH